jgi:hypothetical protein
VGQATAAVIQLARSAFGAAVQEPGGDADYRRQVVPDGLRELASHLVVLHALTLHIIAEWINKSTFLIVTKSSQTVAQFQELSYHSNGRL